MCIKKSLSVSSKFPDEIVDEDKVLEEGKS